MKIQREKTVEGKKLDEAVKKLSQERKVGKVGWLKKAKYKDGTPVAYVATIQEFGDPSHNIPPRPTVRPTMKARQLDWKEITDQGFKDVIRGKKTPEQAMKKVVLAASGDIKTAIKNLTAPALKESTISARVNRKTKKDRTTSITKPLIDSGIMLLTLSGVVENEDSE